MKATYFSRTYNRNPANARTRVCEASVSSTATLAELLEAGHAAGASKGGRGRTQGGTFEIQTDLGIWSSDDGGKLDHNHGTFASWEELEASELAA